jgi:hypothetical protein
MNEIVERVAKAMWERANSTLPEDLRAPWEGDDFGPIHQDEWRANARAALQAMREPTMLQLASGQWAQFENPSPPVRDCVEANARAEKIWKAMIDRALAD